MKRESIKSILAGNEPTLLYEQTALFEASG